MTDLSNGTAVVTGGGSGIGRGMVLTWAAEGMNVVVADIELAAAEGVAAEARAAGAPRALAVQCDVTDRASVEALAETTYAEFGAVRVLCNNAGIIVTRPLLECSLKDWEWTFAVNLFGVVHCVYAFLPRMQKQGSPAHIVNTASDAGITGGPTSLFNESAPGRTEGGIYAASKHAVVSYSEQLMNSLRPLGIGVSVFCPSLVTSQISQAERNRPAEMGAPSSDIRMEELARARATFRSGAMDPLVAGGLVRDAVASDRFYIFTDYRVRDYALRRWGTILEDFSVLAPRRGFNTWEAEHLPPPGPIGTDSVEEQRARRANTGSAT